MNDIPQKALDFLNELPNGTLDYWRLTMSVNRKTGVTKYSMDGGKTWTDSNPLAGNRATKEIFRRG